MQIAKNENKLGIIASYYFRAVPESWYESIIKEISALGHEIAYHYENMDTCRGDLDKAWDDFRYHLEKLRRLTDVKTICMHGSPRSEFDNKEIWKKYDYKSLGIIGEPYYDVNFDKVFYLTDTGRKWDGDKVSVRDKVGTEKTVVQNFHSTNDIIKATEKNELADKIMITMHPQRWSDKPLPWLKEFVMQNIKNVVKKHFFVKKHA